MKRLQSLSRRASERALDDQDRVARDVFCIRCGVNLVSLKIDGGCPNCLHPISDSVFGDYLIHSDPAEVRRRAEAARFVRIGAAFLGGLVGFALAITLIAETLRGDFARAVDATYRMLFAGTMIAPLVAALGLGTLTVRHRFAWYRAQYGNPAALNRLALLALGIGSVLMICMNLAPRITGDLLLVAWAAGPATMFLRRLTRMMRRVPNLELASFARLASWGVLLSGAALFGVRRLARLDAEQSGWHEAFLSTAAVYIVIVTGVAIGCYRLIGQVERVLLRVSR